MATSPEESPRADQRVPLAVLDRRVHAARREVAARRGAGVHRDELARAHGALLAALEAFTGALAEQGLPVPPALTTELRLHRDLWC